MPCYDPRDSYDYQANELRQDLKEEKEKTAKWEAGFCAIVNRLETYFTKDQIIQFMEEAGKTSKMNVLSLYKEHLAKDISRLEEDLDDRYSADELKLIEEILKKRKK